MQRLANFAAAHHGVFDMRAADAADVTRHTLASAAQTGEIVRLHMGVYRFAAVPPTWEAGVLAACLAPGRRGFASHESAAALHGLPGGNRNLIVITCPRWRRAQRPGLVVHESTKWDSVDIAEVNAIPTASPALTLLQLAGSSVGGATEAALERSLRLGITTLAELDDLIRRYAKRGRPGIRHLRRLVRARDHCPIPTDSERETTLLQLIRRHGLPEPDRQYVVRDRFGRKVATVDLAYATARIGIEYDSDEFHTGRVATASDSERRHRIIEAGWLPITAVNSDVTSGGHGLCRALRAARSPSVDRPFRPPDKHL